MALLVYGYAGALRKVRGPVHRHESVVKALRQWRESLDEPAWARTAFISGVLAGGRPVSPGSLCQAWHLPTRGYREGRA